MNTTLQFLVQRTAVECPRDSGAPSVPKRGRDPWISIRASFRGLVEGFVWGVCLGGGLAQIHVAMYRRQAVGASP